MCLAFFVHILNVCASIKLSLPHPAQRCANKVVPALEHLWRTALLSCTQSTQLFVVHLEARDNPVSCYRVVTACVSCFQWRLIVRNTRERTRFPSYGDTWLYVLWSLPFFAESNRSHLIAVTVNIIYNGVLLFQFIFIILLPSSSTFIM